MIDNVFVGRHLRQIREEEGYSTEKVAEFLHVEEQFLNRLEEGDVGIPSDLLERLSSLYLVSVSDILDADDVFDKIPESLRNHSECEEEPEQSEEKKPEIDAEDGISDAAEAGEVAKADLAELLKTCFTVGLILVGMFGIIRKLTGRE